MTDCESADLTSLRNGTTPRVAKESVGAGDLGQGLASLSAGQRLSFLMLGELRLASEMHAPRPGPLPATWAAPT